MTNYAFYKDFCIAFCKFAIQDCRNSINPDKQFIDEMIGDLEGRIDKIQNAFDTNNRRVLSAYYKAFLTDSKYFTSFYAINRQYFLNNYSIDLFELDTRRKKKINSIISRGKIKTDDEYYIMLEYADQICQESEDSSILDAVNELLLNYEEKKAKK